MFKHLLILFILIFSFSAFGQSKFPAYYAVYLSDKANNAYSITQGQNFMSQRAIDRYQAESIAFTQEDLPVTTSYLDSITARGAIVYSTSKWMNAALVICADTQQLVDIAQFSKVQSMQYLGPYDTLSKQKVVATGNEAVVTNEYVNLRNSYGNSYHQFNMIGIPHLHQNGVDGTGIHIAVLDAGFWKADKTQAFDSLRAHQGILSTRDIVHHGNDVYKESTHGAHVLSTMAALLPGQYRGGAYGASFHLFRTEITASEYPYEEFHWIVGAELADSLGADIITSSLSYRTFDDSTLNYIHADLNGLTSLITRGADIAASKGILVLNSAGNDAQSSWQKIGFPADAFNILTVGAVDSAMNYASFSSVGFTSDGRIKPEVATMGQQTYLVNANDEVFKANGTSFSTPLLAGGIALLMQSNPTATASEVRQAVIESASQYSNPDSLIGYGIPNLIVADMILKHLDIPIITEKETFKVVPNPFVYEVSIIYDALDTQYINIEVFDLAGKKVWVQQKVYQQKGHNVFRLSGLESLSDGVYFIRITGKSNVYSQKIVKHQ